MASQKSLSAEGWGAWTQDAIVGPWGIAPNRVMGPRTLTTELGPHQNKQGLTTVGSAPVERGLPELGGCRLPHKVLLMPRKSSLSNLTQQVGGAQRSPPRLQQQERSEILTGERAGGRAGRARRSG